MRLQFLALTASVSLVAAHGQNAFFVALAPGPLRLVHPDAHAHTHGYNHTHTLSRRDVNLVPAAKCDAAAPSPCDTTDAFCCAESTQCRASKSSTPAGKTQTQWLCAHKGELESAMECGASDTPCSDGLSCCPEDMSCAAEGGCVGEMSPADGDGDEEESPCVDGETPCVNACCTEKETCNVSTGVCMAASEAGAPAPAAAPAGTGAALTNATNTNSSSSSSRLVASNTNTHAATAAALVTVTAVPMPNTGVNDHDGAGSVGLLMAVLGVTFMASLA